jgi:hypothetical protein
MEPGQEAQLSERGMWEIFVGAAKVLLTKNGISAMRDFFNWSKKSPEWKNDIVEISAKIKKAEKEQAQAFTHAVKLKLHDAHFNPNTISEFLSAFQELIDNGFAHGCVVILVFGSEYPARAASTRIRAAASLENRETVSQFAIVCEKQSLDLLDELQIKFPKLVGCYASPEEAIAALKPELSSGAIESKGKSGPSAKQKQKPK